MSGNTVPVYFKWVSLAPDPRAYKPGGPPIFEPEEIFVRLEIPSEYIWSEEPQIEITLEGMKYIIDQFEAAIGCDHKVKLEPDLDEEVSW